MNNTGDLNTGNRNTGDCNTGDGNTGNRNTGNLNTGNRNTGYRNTGYRNTGYSNTGNCNTGDRNTGDLNTGYCNTGYRNTGNRNTGYCNTGNCNTGDWNTGSFNRTTPTTIDVFEKPCLKSEWDKASKPNLIFFNLTEWVSESEMTDKEKEDNPNYSTPEGYLRCYEYKEAFQKSYNEANEEDKALLLKLPNFDAEIFFDISGIDVRVSDEDKKREQQKKEILEQIEVLKKQAEEL